MPGHPESPAAEAHSAASVLVAVGRVLDLPAVDPDDDFFELGGTSLSVVRTIAVLKEEYGLEVSARQFVRDARIRAIAAACRPLTQ
jgi:acyl carrier protein